MTRKACSHLLALVLSTLGTTAVAATDGTSNTIVFTYDKDYDYDYDVFAGCTARLAGGRGSTAARFTIDVGTREGMHLEEMSLGGDDSPTESLSLKVVTAPDRPNTLMISLSRENSIERVSTRPAIVAVLIGLLPTPVPALAFQDGDQIRLVAFDGADFRLIAQQPAPSTQAVELQNTLVSGFRLPGVEIHTCAVVDGGE